MEMKIFSNIIEEHSVYPLPCRIRRCSDEVYSNSRGSTVLCNKFQFLLYDWQYIVLQDDMIEQDNNNKSLSQYVRIF